MSDEQNPDLPEDASDPGDSGQPDDSAEPGDETPGDVQSQQIQHRQVGALVPENVAPGVFSTGTVIVNGNYEFIIDFLLRMTKPHQVAARVVIPPAVVPRLIQALSDNLENYRTKFGEPKLPDAALPKPGQPQPQVSLEDLYDELKFADTDMNGTYANAVMIAHSPTEFSFDFIATFFPKSIVSSRVFLAAPNVPRFLDSLKHSWAQFQKKIAEQQNPPPASDSFDTTQF